MAVDQSGAEKAAPLWSFLHIDFDSFELGFGEDRKAVCDQIDRVIGLALGH